MAQRSGAMENLGLTGKFWAGRRVLVTGHTGFKGGWFCVWLQQLGAEVFGIALEPPTSPSLYNVGRVARGMVSERANLVDAISARDLVAKVEPEIVFHMAAQALVRQSYEEPLTTLSTNILGTANVLEAIREVGSAKAVLVVTSDKCYENRELKAHDESQPLGGHDPYSCSKACAELVCAAYRKSFLEHRGIHLATARSGNVFGGGDWSRDRLVPDFVRAAIAGQSVAIRNPSAIRPWQHVLDPLCGYLLLAERLATEGAPFAQAWNFGPDPSFGKSVAEVMQLLVEYWGDGAEWQHRREIDQPHEAMSLVLDSAKATSRLGWVPVWDLEEGLRRTVEWYKEFSLGRDMREFMEAQISEYLIDFRAARVRRNKSASHAVKDSAL